MGKGQDRVYDLGRAFRVRGTQSRQHRVAVRTQTVHADLFNRIGIDLQQHAIDPVDVRLEIV